MLAVCSRVEPAGNGSISTIHPICSGSCSLQPCYIHCKQISLGMFVQILFLSVKRPFYCNFSRNQAKYDSIWLNSSFYSLIPYVPLRGTPWLIFCPASLSSTSCTSVQRLTHSSPSGKSTSAQSKVSFIVFHVYIETTVQPSHVKNSDFM